METTQPVQRKAAHSNRTRFLALLDELLTRTSLSTTDVVELAEERCQHSYVELSEVLASAEVDLRELLSNCLDKSIDSICLLPVASYIQEHVARFNGAFDEVVLCDNKKAGREIAGRTVLSQTQLDHSGLTYDAYVNTTSSREVEALFERSIPDGCGVSFNQFATALVRETGSLSSEQGIEQLVARIANAARPLVILSGIYLNTYTPTLRALAKEGYDIFVVARSSTAWIHAGHLAKIDSTLDFADVVTVDLDGMLLLLDRLDHGSIFIPGAEESFIGCAFDCSRAAASAAYVAAIEQFSKVPVLLGLYDIIKPVTKSLHSESDLMVTFKAMLENASAISIGANSIEAGIQAVSAFGVTTPVESFYRYGVYVEGLEERLGDGIHIAMVGGALVSDSDNPFLPGFSFFKELLDQELHLHVFSSALAPRRFESTLTSSQRTFFHVHDSIQNPYELTRELSRYHAGMIINDTVELSRMIAGYKQRVLGELAYHFLTTMTPSAAMLFGCAGLPIILNRTMSSLLRQFPAEHFIPTELSEFARLGDRLRRIDWDHCHEVTRDDRRLFSIDTNIDRFVQTIDDLGLNSPTE
ncbi:MAG: hypothetical protein ACI8TQ_001952 [Planctomycetota bacterium]|jgi:hypothetical protein